MVDKDSGVITRYGACVILTRFAAPLHFATAIGDCRHRQALTHRERGFGLRPNGRPGGSPP